MKRTNLVLNEETLETAVRVLGCKTYSEAVNRALDEAIQAAYRKDILNFAGSNSWKGDLSKMREDRPVRRPKRKKGTSP